MYFILCQEWRHKMRVVPTHTCFPHAAAKNQSYTDDMVKKMWVVPIHTCFSHWAAKSISSCARIGGQKVWVIPTHTCFPHEAAKGISSYARTGGQKAWVVPTHLFSSWSCKQYFILRQDWWSKSVSRSNIPVFIIELVLPLELPCTSDAVVPQHLGTRQLLVAFLCQQLYKASQGLHLTFLKQFVPQIYPNLKRN